MSKVFEWKQTKPHEWELELSELKIMLKEDFSLYGGKISGKYKFYFDIKPHDKIKDDRMLQFSEFEFSAINNHHARTLIEHWLQSFVCTLTADLQTRIKRCDNCVNQITAAEDDPTTCKQCEGYSNWECRFR